MTGPGIGPLPSLPELPLDPPEDAPADERDPDEQHDRRKEEAA